MIVLPIVAFAHLLVLPHGEFGRVQVMGLSLVTLRVDKLSLLFGYVFLLAAFLGGLYALHVRDAVQQASGLIYAGSALGAVFAGDLVTLFIFWEGLAIASVFLVWASRTERAYRAGMRYIVVQLGSGVLLFAGILIHYHQTGSLAFGAIGLTSPGAALILLAFGVKCAFPLLHNWLQDAYPEATVTGTVLLSSFTTKVAVYALARGFAGTEILVPIGAAMTAFPIFYAVIENDLRRVLAYSLNNQLGFMVVGIGIGTELALNGAVAHAFADILFKALLFMSMGAVLFRVGTVKGSELGGLYKSMPWTAGFCLVGAASISAFPLFSGFVTKSMVIAAAMEGGYFWTWIVLLFASAGVFHHAGIKIPYFAFFAHDSGKRCEEAPATCWPRWPSRRCFASASASLPTLVLFPSAVSGRIPPVQPRPRRRTSAIAVPVRACIHAADADRNLSAGTSFDESGLRLVLSSAGAPGCACGRTTWRSVRGCSSPAPQYAARVKQKLPLNATTARMASSRGRCRPAQWRSGRPSCWLPISSCRIFDHGRAVSEDCGKD